MHTLRKADRVVAVPQLGEVGELCGGVCDLFINMSELAGAQ
jgi:hypothetical protein